MMKNKSNFPNKNVGSALNKLTKEYRKIKKSASRRRWWSV